MVPMSTRERLLTPRFLLVVASGLSYFMAIGMLIPVVPRYVKGPLSGPFTYRGTTGMSIPIAMK